MPTLQDLLQKADCYEAVSHGSAYDFILKLARQQVWGWPVPRKKQKRGRNIMKNLMIPDHYEPALNLHDTQIAIKTVKDFFQNLLAERLNLLRVSAPLFVTPQSGLNDNLNRRKSSIPWQSGKGSPYRNTAFQSAKGFIPI